jgi:hypothetical protein
LDAPDERPAGGIRRGCIPFTTQAIAGTCNSAPMRESGGVKHVREWAWPTLS